MAVGLNFGGFSDGVTGAPLSTGDPTQVPAYIPGLDPPQNAPQGQAQQPAMTVAPQGYAAYVPQAAPAGYAPVAPQAVAPAGYAPQATAPAGYAPTGYTAVNPDADRITWENYALQGENQRMAQRLHMYDNLEALIQARPDVADRIQAVFREVSQPGGPPAAAQPATAAAPVVPAQGQPPVQQPQQGPAFNPVLAQMQAELRQSRETQAVLAHEMQALRMSALPDFNRAQVEAYARNKGIPDLEVAYYALKGEQATYYGAAQATTGYGPTPQQPQGYPQGQVQGYPQGQPQGYPQGPAQNPGLQSYPQPPQGYTAYGPPAVPQYDYNRPASDYLPPQGQPAGQGVGTWHGQVGQRVQHVEVPQARVATEMPAGYAPPRTREEGVERMVSELEQHFNYR